MYEPSDLDVAWEPFTPYNRTYLYLSTHASRLKQHLRPDKVSFWNSLIPVLQTGTNETPTQADDEDAVPDWRITCPENSEASPSMWIFIAINVGLAMVVLILMICLLRMLVQLRRYKTMCSNFDKRTNILPRRV